jgi:hypothetical protein
MTSLSQADEDLRKIIQQATGLEDVFFDAAKNALSVSKNTNNSTAVEQASDLFKTADTDAIQSYNSVVSKDPNTWGAGFTPTDEDVLNVLGTIGGNPDLDSQTAIDQYVDPRYVDIDEIKEIAAGQGYEITDERAAELAGQFNEAEKLAEYDTEFDTLATTEDEVLDFFDRYRYSPTDEEVGQFVSGTLGEEAQRGAIGSYLFPGLGGASQEDLDAISGSISGIGDRVGGLEEGLGQLGQGLGEGIGGVLGLVSGMGRDLSRQTRTNTLLSLLNAGGSGGQQQEVKSVDPARIGYMYDIGGESIFATPQQEQMFISPYASGGQVDNTTDALLRLLEGK